MPHSRLIGMYPPYNSRTAHFIRRFVITHITDKAQFSTSQLLIWLFLVVIVQVLDYFTPMIGSKYSGGSKWGSWGCLIGSIVGIIFLGPWGIVIGPLEELSSENSWETEVQGMP